MALRDRQVSGIPLTERQSEIISHLLTALVPVIGYKIWYPMFGVPEELRIWFAIAGILIHFGQSAELVPNNVERNLLWMGSYTGASFSNGLRWIPRIPSPFFLILVRIVFGAEIYRKIFWSLEGDVSVETILAHFRAEGLTRDGARVSIAGSLRLEVENAAVFRSQTSGDAGIDTLKQSIVAEYAANVRSSVITQHTLDDLMRGYHSGNSKTLSRWMTEAWELVGNFGVELASAPIVEVKILSDQVRQAFDREQGKEIFDRSIDATSAAWTRYRQQNPNLSEEIAWAMFASAQGLPAGTPITIVKFK